MRGEGNGYGYGYGYCLFWALESVLVSSEIQRGRLNQVERLVCHSVILPILLDMSDVVSPLRNANEVSFCT
jgi:hypothetical protein